MNVIIIEVLIIFALILVNGILAMAEIALVSSRRTKLSLMAKQGDSAAQKTLDIQQNPSRFLSMVQVGITLVGVLAGAFGGATIAEQIAKMVEHIPYIGSYGQVIGIAIVVTLVTFLSVVVGELVPKQIALGRPEQFAKILSVPLDRLSIAVNPVIRILSYSSEKILGLMGVKKNMGEEVSEDEVRGMIEQGFRSGIFNEMEKNIVDGALSLDILMVEDIMTDKTHIVWLDINDPDEVNWRKIAGSGHSHFPAYNKSIENIVGIVSVKSLWANQSLTGKADIQDVLRKPVYVSVLSTAISLMEEFKLSATHFALAIDEFGAVRGIVTINNLFEAIVGDLPEKEQTRNPKAFKREDGTWLIDGLMDMDDIPDHVGLPSSFKDEKRNVKTLGGYLTAKLGRIPREGDRFSGHGFRFEVVDMDRQRVDKVLVSQLTEPDKLPSLSP